MMKSILALALLMAGTAQARAIQAFSLAQMNPAIDLAVFDSNDFDDAVFMIEAYQLRCGYCDDNAPNMAALAAEYADDSRYKFIDLGLDQSNRDYAQWIARHDVQHYVLKDENGSVFRELGGRGTPTAYVLDAELNILWEHEGVWSETAKREVRELLDSLLD